MRSTAAAFAVAATLALAAPSAEAARQRSGGGSAPATAQTQVPAPDDAGAQCRFAIQAAEREHGLAPGLLLAIGRVESGRPDPRGGGYTPWPWTINAEGAGRHFATKAEAVAYVQALQARGVRIVDVGCMQVNLHHHPAAFADLEAAFDPATNARYAGLFLKRLQAATGDWEQAAARYHSATPERGDAYRLRVLAHWPGMQGRLLAERARDPALVTAALSGQAGPVTAAVVLPINIRVAGQQMRALAMNTRLNLSSGGDRGLLDPVPPVRIIARPLGGRPVFVAESAQPMAAGQTRFR